MRIKLPAGMPVGAPDVAESLVAAQVAQAKMQQAQMQSQIQHMMGGMGHSGSAAMLPAIQPPMPQAGISVAVMTELAAMKDAQLRTASALQSLADTQAALLKVWAPPLRPGTWLSKLRSHPPEARASLGRSAERAPAADPRRRRRSRTRCGPT